MHNDIVGIFINERQGPDLHAKAFRA